MPDSSLQFTDDELSRYCLGILPEPRLSEVEEALFRDPSIEEQIESIEEQVTIDYLTGGLSPEDRSQFEVQMSIDSGLRKRAEELRCFRAAIVSPQIRKTPNLQVVRRMLAHHVVNSKFAYGLAASVLLMGWMIWENSSLRDRMYAASRESSAYRAEVLQVREQLEAMKRIPPVEVSLAPGTWMGESKQRRISLSPDARILNLRLETRRPASQYRGVLRNSEGLELWSGTSDTPNFVISAFGLASGDYLLSLETPDSKGEYSAIESYAFALMRH